MDAQPSIRVIASQRERYMRPGWEERLSRFPFIDKWTRREAGYGAEHVEIPPSLRLYGQSVDLDRPVVGIGGTRSPSVEAFKSAFALAKCVAKRGGVVCSGGVPGVDLAAHLGALDASGGTTLAVLANPVEGGLSGHEWDCMRVSDAIAANGAFISEYEHTVSTDTAEFRRRLLQRDRIITALSGVFVMFESSPASATMDSAKRAAIQGRPVFAQARGATLQRQGPAIAIRAGLAEALPDGDPDRVAKMLIGIAEATQRCEPV
jgi:predicted Rossmann fold nucleotide-binding protein DprA/Smf involved in DNA uptake